MTQAEWLDLTGWMCRLWPHAPVEPATAVAWFPFVADLDAASVRTAIGRLVLDDLRFPPSPGRIRAAVSGPAREWTDALAELRNLAARHGSYQPQPDSTDPALDRVIAGFGWQACCQLDFTDAAHRAQFRDAYRAAQTQHRDDTLRAVADAAVQTALPPTSERHTR